MKHKGSRPIFYKERYKDLYEKFHILTEKHLAMYGRICTPLLLMQLVNTTAKRYWLSPERAYAVVSQIRKGTLKVNPDKNVCRLYYSLYDDFICYKKQHPEIPDTRAIEYVIQQPAPCFGLEPRVAGIIIRKMSKQCQKEKILRLISRL